MPVRSYRRDAGFIEVVAELVIGNGANTGSAAVTMSLPKPSAGYATGSGWEAVGEPKRPLMVFFSGSTALITYADTLDPAQKYPGAPGRVLEVRLRYLEG